MTVQTNKNVFINQDQFVENFSFQKAVPDQKILITYASQFGSTAKVAESIGDYLLQKGIVIETRWIKEVKALSQYDAVIIGSPIQFDRWRSEATSFVLENEAVLANMPVAYFFTCLVLVNPTAKAIKQAQGYADKLQALSSQVSPVTIGQFAGALNKNKMPFFYRFMFKGLTAVTGIQQGDYRDWDAIRSWTNRTYSQFMAEKN